MNAHLIDIEALRREAQQSEDRRLYTMRVKPQAMLDFLDLLAAAEHRATRAEAQSAIRGRAVAIYRERARQAEAERDEWRQTALETVAADIWDRGYAACYARQLQSDRWPYPDEDERAEKEYAEARGRAAATRAPNPYRASETA